MKKSSSNKKVVNPTYSIGKGEYERVISDIESKGKCPFCPENFIYHKHPVLKRSGTWFITKSSWPYKNAKYHFLLLSTKHKEEFKDYTLSDFRNVIILTNWAIKEFKILGGGLVTRFGNTDYTGATVCHLHFHLISPTRRGKKTEFVSFPIG